MPKLKFVGAIVVVAFAAAGLVWLAAKRSTSPPQPATAVAPPAAPTSSAGQSSTSGVQTSGTSSISVASTTAQSSSSLCKPGERLISVPTSTVLLPRDPFTPDSFCFRPVIGPALSSPNGKWTAAIESNGHGSLLYKSQKLPVVPYDKYGTEDSVVYDRDVFVVFVNLGTSEKKEVAIVSLVPQGIFASLKKLELHGAPEIDAAITKWSSDGKSLWGEVDLFTGEYYCTRFDTQYRSLFYIDTSNWRATLYLMPDGLDVGAMGDVLNADRGMFLYLEKSNTSTSFLNIYNLASQVTTTLASFEHSAASASGRYNEQVEDIGPSSDIPTCEGVGLSAKWINSSTVSWVDPQTGKTVVKSIL